MLYVYEACMFTRSGVLSVEKTKPAEKSVLIVKKLQSKQTKKSDSVIMKSSNIDLNHKML